MNGFDLLVINDDIKRDMLSRICEVIKEQQSQRLFLVINTLGGLPGIAYRAMRDRLPILCSALGDAGQLVQDSHPESPSYLCGSNGEGPHG